jgi:hypothetical protein
MIMRLTALVILGVILSSTALIAANPAIIWGSGGYAENLAPTGIKMKSGRVLDADANGIQTDLDFEVGRDLDVIGFSTLDNTLVSSNNGTAGLQINHSGTADALNIAKSGSGEAIESVGEIKFRDTAGGLDPFVRIMDNAESATYFSVNASGMQLNGGSRVTTILNENNMVSNSSTALATQSSIKAYTDSRVPSQSGNSGRYLFTNGTSTSWSRVDSRINLTKNNLLANGSFDSVGISAEYVVVTDAVVDLTTITGRTGEVAANNTSMLTLEATNGDATPWEIKATFTKTADFSGQQMLAYCEIRTTRSDAFFSVGADSIQQSSQNIIGDGKWRYYSYAFVGGSTSQYIEINGETTASEDVINVDNCFMGKVSPEIAIAGGLPSLSKGGLITSDGSNNGELAVGTDGQILAADSTETSGLKWIDAPRVAEVPSKSKLISHFEAFPAVIANAGVTTYFGNATCASSGTGSFCTSGGSTEYPLRSGVNITTGSTTTGRTYLSTIGVNPTLASFKKLTYETGVQITALSNGTDRFVILDGFSSGSLDPTAVTRGVFFRYSDNINGGRWELRVLANDNTQDVIIDTGVSASTSFVTLRIEMTTTQITAYIDDALVATHSHIPDAGWDNTKMIRKTAGTTSRNYRTNYVSTIIELN